jgi:hypothetical protein
VPVLLLLTVAAIICGVIVVAIGRGGEMAAFSGDRPLLQPEVQTAADIALLRPPWGLWGYQARATDEALGRIAQTVAERDVEIATLRRQLAELQSAAGQQQAPGGLPTRRGRAAREDLPSPQHRGPGDGS